MPGADPLGLRVQSCEKLPNVLPNGGLILGSCARRLRRITEGRPFLKDRPTELLRFPPLLLAQSLPRKRFFGPALFAGLHVETVLLNLLDDVFLLHFALKTPQCVF